MPAKIIQAEARISAIDATGETFANIARKIGRVTSAFKALGTISSTGIGNTNRAIGRLQHTARVLGPVASSGAAYEGMRGLSGLVHETIQATADRQREIIMSQAAGMMPKTEVPEAQALAQRLSEKYMSLGASSIMDMLINARSVVGSFAEVKEIIDPLLQMQVALQGAHPEKAKEIAEQLDLLIKAMEMKGVTTDPQRFTQYMDAMTKAVNVFSKTLTPEDYYSLFKYGRQAINQLSDKFMLETANTLSQEMKGKSAGQLISDFNTQFVSGKMSNQAVAMMARLGLLDPNKVIKTKTGSVKGVLPGGVIGSIEAMHDPYAWVQDYLLPSLKTRGITKQEDIVQTIDSLASNRMVAQMLNIFATQQTRIEKDLALVEGAQGLDSYKLYMNKDLTTNATAIAEQFKNLLVIAASPLADPAAAGMHKIAEGIVAIENAAKGHPAGAAAGLGLGLAGGGYAGYRLSRYALGRF